jgi:hypothetical protein
MLVKAGFTRSMWGLLQGQLREGSLATLFTSHAHVPHFLNLATLFWDVTILVVAAMTTWRPQTPPASAANLSLVVSFGLYYSAMIASCTLTKFGVCWALLPRVLARRVAAPLLATVYLGFSPSSTADSKPPSSTRMKEVLVLDKPHGAGQLPSCLLSHTPLDPGLGHSSHHDERECMSELQALDQRGFSVLKTSLRCAKAECVVMACMGSARGGMHSPVVHTESDDKQWVYRLEFSFSPVEH